MDFALINVALHYGADCPGVELGPSVLEPHVLEILNANGHTVSSTTEISERTCGAKYHAGEKMKWVEAVADVAGRVCDAGMDALRRGLVPLTIGGDHALGIGTATAAANVLDDLLIVWLDAHADMNTAATSPTGNVHGTVLSAVFGEGDPRLRRKLQRPIAADHILLLGARSIDPGEQEFIDALSINHIHSDELRATGPRAALERVRELVRRKGIRNIHLSIDIDVLDPAVAPATGVPEAGGISAACAEELVRGIMATGLVRAVDFVEYNPQLDADGRTLQACRKVLTGI